MKSILYKGYHSQEAFNCFKQAYEEGDFILFLPPTQDDLSFLKHLPESEIHFRGELWENIPDLKNIEFLHKYETLPCCGVFTSGSSQEPRLVLYSKENLESSIKGIYSLFDSDKFDSIYCYPQPFHTFGLTLGYAAALLLNKEIQFTEGRYSRQTHLDWDGLDNNKVLTLGTPTHFHDLIGWTKENHNTPNKTYSCIIGGAKVPKKLWDDCKNTLNIDAPSIGYGASEAAPGVTHLPPGLKPSEDGEIGFPLAHVETHITQQGLQFSGPNLCLALIEDDSLYFPDRYLLPDIIKPRDSDGVWIYQTRTNWFLNRGGEKFSMEKLEKEVLDKTQIEVLCVSLPCPRLGEDLGLLIQSKGPGFEDIRQKVYQALKEITLRDFNTDKCIGVSEFPVNASHKIDRRQAQKLFP